MNKIKKNICDRQKIKEMLSDVAGRHNRFGDRFYTLKISIGSLQSINRKAGYDKGDEIINELGGLLTDLASTVDIVGRWKNCEYIIIMPEIQINDVLKNIEYIKKTIIDHFVSYVDLVFSFSVKKYVNENLVVF